MIQARAAIPGALALGIALLLQSLLSTASRAEDTRCPELSAWLEVAGAPAARNISERSRAQELAYARRTAAAEAVYRSFLARTLDVEGLERCLEGRQDRGNFLSTLYASFYRLTVESLRSTSSPEIRRFVGELDRRNVDGVPMFRMTGHFEERSPVGYRAGYHRGSGSIFVDWSRVGPDEWKIILVHELLHSLDEKLWQAQAVYADAALAKRIAAAEASPSELRRWLEAGLDRGLWAEHRAWLRTFAIYEEGLTTGLWKPIPWLQTLLTEAPAGEPFERSLYRYLDVRSVDPDQGLFALPHVQAQLRSIRAEARR